MAHFLYKTTAIITAALSITLANNTEIDQELSDLFGSSPESSSSDFIVEEHEDAATAASEISVTNHPQENITTTPEPTEQLTVALEPIESGNKPVRTENFLLEIHDSSISYILPISHEDVIIELLSLDGSILKTTNHTKDEVKGSFDTSILNEGYYIVRISDSIQKNNRIARAVAVKH